MKIVVILCGAGGGRLRASYGDGLPGKGQPTLCSGAPAARRQPRAACPAEADAEEDVCAVPRRGAVLEEVIRSARSRRSRMEPR